MKTALKILLPEPMKEWVDEQIAAGAYRTPSALIQELVRKEQRRRIRAQVEKNLLEALDSGESTPVTPALWEEIRREGRKLIAQKRKAQKRKRR